MKKIIFFLFLVNTICAQQSNNWYFGYGAGLNFSTEPPTVLLDGELYQTEGCATISDNEGNLLFYTDGKDVWNKNHQVMPNGSNLMGHPSSTQSAIVVPYPGQSCAKYYIVTIGERNGSSGVRYSLVDMSLDGGMGDIVTSEKNIHLFGTTTTESICIAKHNNGNDFWVIGKPVNTGEFYSFLVSSTGFNTTPVISSTNYIPDANYGSLKMSPNNQLLAACHTQNSSQGGGVFVFNFNDETGSITQIFNDSEPTIRLSSYSVEFSPNSSLLYFSRIQGALYQYDLNSVTNTQFVNSRQLIATTNNPYSSTGEKMGALQSAPNGKIYVALLDSPTLGIIENPNVLGVGCNYQDLAQDLGGRISRLGLPAFSTFLINPAIVFPTAEFCSEDIFTFPVTSVDGTWQNENGDIITEPNNLQSAIYTFTPNAECSLSSDWAVTINPNITPTFTQIPPINLGDTFSLPTTSTNGITGTWSPALNNTTTTTYTFTPDTGQCASTTTTTVAVIPPCNTSEWESYFRFLNGTQAVPFNEAIHPSESLMYLDPTLATNSYYWSHFIYTPEIPVCLPNNFYIEVELNSNSPLGLPAYDTLLELDTSGGMSWINLLGQAWGQPWTQLGVNDNLLLSNTPDLIFPSILDWYTIKMEYNNNTLNYYLNNQLFYSGTYEGDVCNLNAIHLRFKGSGSVNYVKVASLDDTVIYLEEFNDCESMNSFPDLCNITPNLQVSINTPDCENPNLELTATINSNVTNLSFEWSGPNGFTSNEQNPVINNIDTNYIGTYTCTVQSNSCNPISSQSINISSIDIDPILVPIFTQVADICSGESLNALPTTSDNGYTGTWSPALNNTATTTYTFTPDAGQCATTASMTITVNPTPLAPTGSTNQIFCTTPTPTVVNLIATGTAVQWYASVTGGSPLTSTTTLVDGSTYYASQTLNGCESSTRLAVTVNFNDSQIIASDTTVCNGTPVTLTASTILSPVANNCSLPSNLQNGLVGYFPFCGNANDESGNGNNGTVNGASLTTDRFGNIDSAYDFNGINNFISIPNIAATGNSSRTFNAWVRLIEINPTSRSNSMISTGYPSNSSTFNFRLASAKLEVMGYNNDVWDSTTNLSPNTWHFCSVTYDSSNIKFYLNGILIDTILISNPYTTSGQNNFFGKNNHIGWEYYLNGKLDDVSMYNRALSQSEISQLYNISQPTFQWSTGENTESINPSPASTTSYWCDVTVNGVTCRKEITITVNPNITPTFTQIADICSGDSLSTLPTTSDNGYTGIWSPALDNTATTTYTFTPDAGQCATTASMTITVNPNITPTFTQIAEICSGDTLSALPTISDNGYTGTWSPELDNTTTTTYTFTPTTDQCATTASMTITVNPNITPTFIQVPSICSGDSLSALPTTSDNGYTGTWSPGLDNTATTTYTFTPDAGQCATTASMTITVNPNITPTFTQIADICSGDTLSALPTTSDNGYTGTGFPALDNTATTTYTFTPTAGQCATTASMTITVNPNITPTFTQIADICSGDSLSALPTTSDNGYTGTWSPALDNTATTTYTFTPTAGQCATTASMTITVNELPATPTGNTVQNFCAIDNPKISDLVLITNEVNWYLEPNDGTILNPNYLLTDGLTLYAAAYDSVTLCESSTRLQVLINLNNPSLPILNSELSFCQETNPTIHSIYSQGIIMNWYDSPNNGNLIDDNYILQDGDILYGAALNLITGCESVNRVMVTISIIKTNLTYYNLISIDDAFNNSLKIENIEKFPENKMEIYNRYGSLVWQEVNYNNVLRVFKGQANVSGVVSKDSYLPTGTYFFILNYPNNCRQSILKGFIHIDNKNQD